MNSIPLSNNQPSTASSSSNQGPSIIRAKSFFVFLFMIGTILLVTTYVGVMNSTRYMSEGIDHAADEVKLGHIPLVTEAKNFSHVPNTAFVFLAMGAQANQMNCPAAIESLVRYSGWDGEIYLITDQQQCFDPKEIVSNAGIKDPKSFHYVVTKESFSSGGIDFQHPKVGFRKSRVRSFQMKTRLFDLITDPAIEQLAYIDCDIIFAKQGCAQEYVNSGPEWLPNMIKFSHIFGHPDGSVTDLHAGTFLIHRKYSFPVLEQWKEQIGLGTDEGDNNAFMTLYEKNKLKPTDAEYQTTPTLPTFYITNPENHQNQPVVLQKNKIHIASILINGNESSYNPLNWFERFVNPIHMNTPKNIACMNHISKARCASYGREVIQDFVNQFHLKTYDDGKYYYCTSSVLQPLLYGWFPFGYLPFCPKMETIL